MNNVDRYITDEVLAAAAKAEYAFERPVTQSHASAVLHAVLPGVLAQHRADVLREAAGDVQEAFDKFVRPAEVAIGRLQALHPKLTAPSGVAYCDHCTDDRLVGWPCPTIQVLGGGE